MAGLTLPQRQAVSLGFLGLLMFVLGTKYTLKLFTVDRQPLSLNDEPALLFFNVDDSCECMKELVQSADQQIENWPETARSHIRIHRINFDQRPGLADQYQVFRYPCMILLDSSGQIVYRQDYPLSEGGPLDLENFEAQIKLMVGQE